MTDTNNPRSVESSRLAEEVKRLAFLYAERFHNFQSFATAEREHDLRVFCTGLDEAIDHLAAQPAAPAVLAEPVAWMDDFGSMILTARRNKLLQSPRRKMGALSYSRPLYTHPASQARSPLTEDEIHAEITRLKDMLP